MLQILFHCNHMSLLNNFWYLPTKSERKRELQNIWAFLKAESIKGGMRKDNSASKFLRTQKNQSIQLFKRHRSSLAQLYTRDYEAFFCIWTICVSVVRVKACLIENEIIIVNIKRAYMTSTDFLSSLLWVKMLGLSGDLKRIARSFLSTSKVSKRKQFYKNV